MDDLSYLMDTSTHVNKLFIIHLHTYSFHGKQVARCFYCIIPCNMVNEFDVFSKNTKHQCQHSASLVHMNAETQLCLSLRQTDRHTHNKRLGDSFAGMQIISQANQQIHNCEDTAFLHIYSIIKLVLMWTATSELHLMHNLTSKTPVFADQHFSMIKKRKS